MCVYLCVGDSGVNSVELWDIFTHVAGEPQGTGRSRIHGLFQEFFLHVALVFLLQFRAAFNALLCITERSLLQLPYQLGIQAALPGGDGVQIPHEVHVSSHSCHVQRRVVVVIQTPHVGTEGHKEGKAVQVTAGCGQVKRRVSPEITLIRLATETQRVGT